jgi:cytidylate kinase
MRTISDLLYEYNVQADARQRSHAPAFCPSILVSREPGSGGLQLSKMLSEQLGFQLWDRNLLNEVASRGRIEPAQAERFDERSPDIWQTVGIHLLTLSAAPTPQEFDSQLVRSIRSLLQVGSVVILGRGATYLAKPRQALRVRVIAPYEKRLANWMERHHLPEATARRELHEIEHERAAFIRRVYGQNETNLANFDLVLNTGELSVSSCAGIVLSAYDELFRFSRGKRMKPRMSLN